MSTDENNENNEMVWSEDIESILNKIRENSALLSNYHKKEYYKYKGYLKYFRIPTIVFSAIGSVASVGLNPYLNQNTISIITCLIGLSVGILNSIELFLTIQSTMDRSLSNSKDFYLLSIDIKKMLLLKNNHRPVCGKEYLDDKYGFYCELIKTSELINKDIEDKLLPLEYNGYNIIDMINNKRKKNKYKILNDKYIKLKKKIIELEEIDNNSLNNESLSDEVKINEVIMDENDNV